MTETVRIWRDGERARIEHHGGPRDGYYAVTDGPLWWMWDERNGAHSNQDDPSVGSGIGEELQIMLNAVPLLGLLRFQPEGSSEVAHPDLRALTLTNTGRLIYCSTDGHESISLSQFPAGGTNPYRELGDGEGWETVTRGGIEMKTRPARWVRHR